jgi:hypothetical protein
VPRERGEVVRPRRARDRPLRDHLGHAATCSSSVAACVSRTASASAGAPSGT